jgi:hypothetical protein
VSQLAAIRSGLPFTVYSYGVSLTGETLINNRADLTSPGAAMVRNQQPDGTLVLLNRNAFAAPSLGTLGNSLRNKFTGPGLVNFDVSLGRSFSIPLLPYGQMYLTSSIMRTSTIPTTCWAIRTSDRLYSGGRIPLPLFPA